MSATFTPSDAVDMSKEKDWAYQLALLDWDKTNILFTKRSLLDFLNYTGVTVDPNLVKIQKLPQYAKFGRISGSAAADSQTAQPQAATSSVPSPSTTTSSAGGFIPTRKVRDLPGGKTSIAIGGSWGEEETCDAPLREVASQEEATDEPAGSQPTPAAVGTSAKPTEKRRNIGTSLGPDMFTAENDVFVPTRRVRDRPGGDDHLTDMFYGHANQ